MSNRYFSEAERLLWESVLQRILKDYLEAFGKWRFRSREQFADLAESREIIFSTTRTDETKLRVLSVFVRGDRTSQSQRVWFDQFRTSSIQNLARRLNDMKGLPLDDVGI